MIESELLANGPGRRRQVYIFRPHREVIEDGNVWGIAWAHIRSRDKPWKPRAGPEHPAVERKQLWAWDDSNVDIRNLAPSAKGAKLLQPDLDGLLSVVVEAVPEGQQLRPVQMPQREHGQMRLQLKLRRRSHAEVATQRPHHRPQDRRHRIDESTFILSTSVDPSELKDPCYLTIWPAGITAHQGSPHPVELSHRDHGA